MRGFNDAHGHIAGDELLDRGSARRLETALVGHGHVYRLGGVQLCALLAGRGAVAGRGLRGAHAPPSTPSAAAR